MKQLITPNPNIPCEPGWCLQYVRQTFGLPAKYGSATEAWEMSQSKHRDRNFPKGMWTPVWYGLDNEPAGHVVLRAPDGSVYSTSDLSNVPHHHPNLEDLEAYYAYYGMTLTYRGWTEDVASYPVMTEGLFVTLTPAEEQECLKAARLVARYINAPTGDIPRKTAIAVWATTILRGGKKISALQELANANTALNAATAQTKILQSQLDVANKQIVALQAAVAAKPVTK